MLQGHFPRQSLDKIEVLKHIINRDYNNINKWTKACAIYCYANMQETEMCDDLTANLFNPDPLLREVSAWAISKKDFFSYKKHTKRLSEQIKKELDAKYMPTNEWDETHKHLSRIEKIFFLKTLNTFKNVPGVILVEFVELVEEISIKKEEIVLLKGASGDSPLFIVVSGKAVMHDALGNILYEFQEKELIGEMLILDNDINQFEIIAAEDCVLLKIDKDRFLEQITDNFEIAKELISVVGRKFKTKDELEVKEAELI